MVRYHRIYHLSERAITIEWEPVIDQKIHTLIMAFDNELKNSPFEGWIENVPGFHSLTIYYNPFLSDRDPMEQLETRLSNFETVNPPIPRKIKVPVCYESAYSLDMSLITKRLGIPADEVIRMHTETKYTVYMIGFMPGFPYMGKINPKLFMERKSVPSTSVPKGSVAIAGYQTGIYPFESPGGWYVVGKTPLVLFKNGESTFMPGDEIEFVSISKQEMLSMMKHGY